ncbi:trypsin-like peptidase domain-containing protein [Gordonia amicalis]|uniref:Trypsin-like peptidase domain-containing protein n=1 Tax=Gordonia amicalis TaxID=89053 RepID=A0ABU4DKR0_9ACTN|nr:trypsin-like peptidase domain-containing protein [Gordonia amicalis]MDV6310001.1 trypsin-like peptidase domain-containing protein [Gordonia amicalis]
MTANPQTNVSETTTVRRAVITMWLVLIGAAATLIPAPAHGVPVHAAAPGAGTVRLGSVMEWGCSYFAAGKDATGREVVITAGHCAPRRLGAAAYFDNARGGHLVAQHYVPGGLDYAAIRLDRGSRVLPPLPVAHPPRPGATVCKLGRMTGRTCGTVTRVGADTFTVAGMRMLLGDSGSPALNAAGHVVGLVSSGDHQALGAGAEMKFLGAMTGVSAPVPVIFARTDKVARELHATIGLRQ